MKPLIKFGALLVVVLLALQPLLACASCGQPGVPCVQAQVCCAAMTGMTGIGSMTQTPGSSMHTDMRESVAVQMAMQMTILSAPAASECGPAVSSIAALPRTAAQLVLAAPSKAGHVAQFLLAALPVTQPATLQTGRQSDHSVRVMPSRQILFQVFRV